MLKSDQPLKISIVGFENGHCYFLFKALKSEPNVEIVAVSFAPRARIIYEKRLGKEAFDGIDIFYDDQEMFNAHPEIEACVLGGANCDHIAEFRMCAERGINVISMKAPSYDMAEFDEMIELQKKSGILVYIELEMRWNATIERIKDIIKSGKLGSIESFTAYNYSHNPMWWQHWMDIPEKSYGKRLAIRPGDKIFRGGCLTDHPHIFDIARYILESDFDTVYAEAAPNMRDGAETEDLVYVIGKMKNGVIFSLDPSYANREPEQARIVGLNFSKYPRPVQVDMQVTGSKGTLYANCFGAHYVESLEPDTMKYTVDGSFCSLDNQRRLFIRNFINDIRSHENHADVTLETHKKTIQAMTVMYDSIYCGKPLKVE